MVLKRKNCTLAKTPLGYLEIKIRFNRAKPEHPGNGAMMTITVMGLGRNSNMDGVITHTCDNF